RRVLAPEGWQPAWQLAPIEAPLLGVSEEGLVDLGPEGLALISRASGLNLGLRAEDEQEALVEGFARLLNSLEGPTQFLVRSRRVDLTPAIGAIEEVAGGLPHPRLEQAARRHARFLAGLSGRRDILRREVIVCLREPAGAPEEAASSLARRFDQAQGMLRAIGISLRRLEPEETASCLRCSTDPEGAPPPAGSSLSAEVIRGAGRCG
ncbi:MAG: PrgI family protein, partial [bacterium]